LPSILKNGFLLLGGADSVSFAKDSGLAFFYAHQKGSALSQRGVVMVVEFDELSLAKADASSKTCLRFMDVRYQPKIIGFSIIPGDFKIE
jgi:hypothetical protein